MGAYGAYAWPKFEVARKRTRRQRIGAIVGSKKFTAKTKMRF